MAERFEKLRLKMHPDARQQSDRLAQDMLSKMSLAELRGVRGLSQQDMADHLNVQQPAVAKLEARQDMRISTLRKHVQALGGRLELIARFPDQSVLIAQQGNSD
jgi:DNA-binding XRE family transcriptional regulator